MLTSLFENNGGVDIRVHLLHSGISEEEQQQIADIARRYNQSIMFYCVDESRFKSFPVGLEFQNLHVGSSHATYYRLFLTEILSPEIDRVIYLDGDTIVLGSLLELWNMDMEGKAVAAVPDSYNNKTDHYNRLRYPQSKGYFNAGVLLIDIDYWRSHNVLDSFVSYAVSHQDLLVCHDQDILNYIFMDSKVCLPLRYNMLNEYWFEPRHSLLSWEYDSQMEEGQKNPIIVHFTCIPKPWFSNCHHPMKREYEHYRALTLWRNKHERRWMPLKYCLETVAIRLVVLIGLRPKEYIVENRYIKR